MAFTITYSKTVTFCNSWRQVLYVNTKYNYTLIIYWNNLYSDTINELLIDFLKYNSSEQKLLYFSCPAWGLG